MTEPITRTTHAIISALEGYKIRLETRIEPKDRSLLERLMQQTIITGVEYEQPIECYQKWFNTYSQKKDQDTRMGLPQEEDEDKGLEDELDGWLG
jgi:hypothetical protein